MRTKCINKNMEYRQRIIDAMKTQALDKGFHKASMSEIAKSAELSVGQIYRYFAHKDDIICALVEQVTLHHLEFMTDFLNKENWLAHHFSETDQQKHDMCIINMEVRAEAARNSTIAKICNKSHQLLQKRAIDIMQERYPYMKKEDIIARIDMLVTITEGLLVRWDYQNRPFSTASIELYRTILNNLLPEVENF